MTKISIVSTLTTLAPSGTLYLGDVDVNTTTIGDVKRLVEHLAHHVTFSSQKLWWRGYRLDNNNNDNDDDQLPLIRACVGVNEGETIDASLEKLVIFLTVDPPKREMPQDERLASSSSSSSSSSPSRPRSSSFDKVRMELARQRNTISNSCVVL